MVNKIEDKVRELAETHWKWVRSLIEGFEEANISDIEWAQREQLFVDAFIHGYKHGKEDK